MFNYFIDKYCTLRLQSNTTFKFWILYSPIVSPAAIFDAAPAASNAVLAAPDAAPAAFLTTFPGVRFPSPPN